MPGRMKNRTSLAVDTPGPSRAHMDEILNLAQSGLAPMFDRESQLFCSRRWMSRTGLINEGLSRRYTMLRLLGLLRAEAYGRPAFVDQGTVLCGLVTDTRWLDNAGDLGLLIWVCALANPETVIDPCTEINFRDVFSHYPDARQGRTMELAWLLAGLAHRKLAIRGTADHADIAFGAYKLIIGNQGPDGFFGHSATYRSLSGMFRGHVGSFADQVYPIYALAKFAQA
jgi:hypothetical protein